MERFSKWVVMEARGMMDDILVFWDNKVLELIEMVVRVFLVSHWKVGYCLFGQKKGRFGS